MASTANASRLRPCPLCNSTCLEVRYDLETTYRYLEKNHVLRGQEHTVCLDCEGSFFADGQLQRNRERFFELERTIVKDIAPREVRDVREKYLITREQATRIFNCSSAVEFSTWETGLVAPPGPAALLLRLALEDSLFIERLAARVGVAVDIPKPEA